MNLNEILKKKKKQALDLEEISAFVGLEFQILTSHAERNTGLWVGNAAYLMANGHLTEGIIFKTFILRFTLRIHILKRTCFIRPEKQNSSWDSTVPHLPL